MLLRTVQLAAAKRQSEVRTSLCRVVLSLILHGVMCNRLTSRRNIDRKIPKTIGVRAKEITNIVADETFIQKSITEVSICDKMIPRILWTDREWRRCNSK